MGVRLCRWLRRAVAESLAVRTVCDGVYRKRVRQGVLGCHFDEGMRRRTRLLCMRAKEESMVFAVGRRLCRFLLRGSLSSYGSYLLLSASFCVLERQRRGRLDANDITFFICIVPLAASVLWLHSKQSLAYAIQKSRLLQWLLHRVCMLPKADVIAESEVGIERRWLSLFAAILTGLLASIISPFYLLLTCGCVLFLLTLCIAPEPVLIAVFAALPFFGLLPHGSVCLAMVLLLASAVVYQRIVCGHCGLRFGALEVLVAFFSLLLACGGRVGVLQAALLLSFVPLEYVFSKSVWRERAIAGISLGASLCSAYGVFQYCFSKAELKWVDVSRFSDIGGRVTSVFSNPNVLAVYLLLTLPVTASAMTKPTDKARQRLFFALATALEGICLVLTWSRGAWLGALAATALLMILTSAESMRALLLTALPMVCWLPLVPHSLSNRFVSIMDMRESSIRYRLFTWKGVFAMLRAHPFGIGVGERAFTSVYPRYALSGIESVPHTHNLLLQITAELGVAGLLCFLAILGCAFLLAVAYMGKLGGAPSSAVIGSTCAVFGCLVMGLFDHVWYHNGLFWLFWAVLAMGVSTIRLTVEDLRREEQELE